MGLFLGMKILVSFAPDPVSDIPEYTPPPTPHLALVHSRTNVMAFHFNSAPLIFVGDFPPVTKTAHIIFTSISITKRSSKPVLLASLRFYTLSRGYTSDFLLAMVMRFFFKLSRHQCAEKITL